MDFFALDFDGVLCDSAMETALTAWRAGARIWPEWRAAEASADVLERFIRLRPALETGYQAILLMRLAYDWPADGIAAAQVGDACRRLLQETGMALYPPCAARFEFRALTIGWRLFHSSENLEMR